MIRSRRFVIAAASAAGALVGAALTLILVSAGLPAAAESWEAMGRLLIGVLFLSIVVAYIVLLATGAAQAALSGRAAGSRRRGPAFAPDTRVRRVLVSAGGGSHAQLGLQLAGQIVGEEDGELTLLRVVPPSRGANAEEDVEEMRAVATRILGPDYPVHVRVAPSASVVDAVIQEASRGYDLLVLGVSEELGLWRWISSTIPERIIEQSPCSVMIVKHTPGRLVQVDAVEPRPLGEPEDAP